MPRSNKQEETEDEEFDRLVKEINVEKKKTKASKAKSKAVVSDSDDDDEQDPDYEAPEEVVKPKRAAAIKAKAINKEIGTMSNSIHADPVLKQVLDEEIRDEDKANASGSETEEEIVVQHAPRSPSATPPPSPSLLENYKALIDQVKIKNLKEQYLQDAEDAYDGDAGILVDWDTNDLYVEEEHYEDLQNALANKQADLIATLDTNPKDADIVARECRTLNGYINDINALRHYKKTKATSDRQGEIRLAHQALRYLRRDNDLRVAIRRRARKRAYARKGRDVPEKAKKRKLPVRAEMAAIEDDDLAARRRKKKFEEKPSPFAMNDMEDLTGSGANAGLNVPMTDMEDLRPNGDENQSEPLYTCIGKPFRVGKNVYVVYDLQKFYDFNFYALAMVRVTYHPIAEKKEGESEDPETPGYVRREFTMVVPQAQMAEMARQLHRFLAETKMPGRVFTVGENLSFMYKYIEYARQKFSGYYGVQFTKYFTHTITGERKPLYVNFGLKALALTMQALERIIPEEDMKNLKKTA